MYTVLVCSNCRHTWVAKGRPKRSMCRKCRKTRQWGKLKKYYKSDDLEEAQIARAYMQAKINENEEHFERALEKGLIKEEVENIIEQDEYLEGLGFDSGEVSRQAERLLDSPDVKRSHRKIIDNWLADPNEPTIDGFLRYIEKQDLEEQKALGLLEGLVQSAQVELPGEVELDDIQAKIDRAEPKEREGEREQETPSDKSKPSGPSSQKQLLLNAVRSDRNESVEEVLAEVEAKGLERKKTLDRLLSLSRSGEITSISSVDIEAAIAEGLAKDNPEVEYRAESPDDDQSNLEETEKHRSSSYQEIIEGSFENLDDPTEEDIIEYAVEHGMSRGKAETYLEKLVRTGEITRSTSGVLRWL